MISFPDFFVPFIGFFHSQTYYDVLQVLIAFAPVVLAVLLFEIFWPLWVRYVRAEYIFKEKHSVLEIRLPKETFKSPAAMEVFLTALHQTGNEGNFFDRYWLGKTRPWFSLEIVSLEGRIKFFIWMRSSWKTFVSSSLYSQFPGIEVHEVEDYTRPVHADPKKLSLWACDFECTKSDVYPIKTYIDYGLDKDPKEEFKIDPITQLLEFLGTVGANQQIWIQIIIRAHKNDDRVLGSFLKTTDKWRDEAKKEINTILLRDPKTKVAGKIDKEGKGQPLSITEGEKDAVTAIERNINKFAFDTGIRVMYLGEPAFFEGSNIGAMLSSFKQFSSEHLNGFKPNGKKWHPPLTLPWQDYMGFRRRRTSKRVLEAYKRRSYFYSPFASESFVLNTESIATIFHFPGQVSQTPTLTRIPSKKGEAPANLPI